MVRNGGWIGWLLHVWPEEAEAERGMVDVSVPMSSDENKSPVKGEPAALTWRVVDEDQIEVGL